MSRIYKTDMCDDELSGSESSCDRTTEGCKKERCRCRDGKDGKDGRDGKNGLRGPKGDTGERGQKGEKGEPGERGPRGEKGECNCDHDNESDKCKRTHACECNECECKKVILNFSEYASCKTGPQNSKLIYKISNYFILMVYGFKLDDAHECHSPCQLFVKHNSAKPHKSGLGCVDNECNEITSKRFVQIDLGDFVRQRSLKCMDPRIRLSGIKKYEQVSIYGSNVFGELGKRIYTYVNNSENCENNEHNTQETIIPSYNTTNLTKTGDLYLYGTQPYRYISITACNGGILLHSLIFYISE